MEWQLKYTSHRFLDEAGDTTFYGKGRKSLIGEEGVSTCFMLGMVKFKQPLEELRRSIIDLQNNIADNPYFQVPSVVKKKERYGYYFHAKDDLPEIRHEFFKFIKSIDCSFEAVVAEKTVERFATVHKDKEELFYADLLSHLLKNKFTAQEKLVLNIASKGTSTRNHNLNKALDIALERFGNSKTARRKMAIPLEIFVPQKIVFNGTNPIQEPLLNVADYLCWAVQRVFEKGETRYYDFMKDKISLVVDLYDRPNYIGYKNFYGPKNPLTSGNKKSPPQH